MELALVRPETDRREAALPQLADQANEHPKTRDEQSGKDAWRRSAQRFGRYIKHGGSWGYAAEVAAWVAPSGPGRPRKSPNGGLTKVSASRFAAEAGVSQQTVSRYLAAWELAAWGGQCELPPSVFIPPGKVCRTDHLSETTWSFWYQRACADPKPRKPKKISQSHQQLELSKLFGKVLDKATKADITDPQVAEEYAADLDKVIERLTAIRTELGVTSRPGDAAGSPEHA